MRFRSDLKFSKQNHTTICPVIALYSLPYTSSLVSMLQHQKTSTSNGFATANKRSKITITKSTRTSTTKTTAKNATNNSSIWSINDEEHIEESNNFDDVSDNV